MTGRTWIVHTAGYPDPSRISTAIHHDDPAHDRNRAGRLKVVEIAETDQRLTLIELVGLPAYALEWKKDIP